MKRQSIVQIIAGLLVIGILIASIFPTTAYAEEAKNNTSLLVVSDNNLADTYGAIAVEDIGGAYRLTYGNGEQAETALNTFLSLGYTAERDIPVDITDEESELTEEVNSGGVNMEDVSVVEDALAEEVEAPNKKEVVVAVIDTGLDVSNAAFSGRLAKGCNPGMTDENGHGTLMAEIIVSQTSENVKILPIQAFDETGSSTVGCVYRAILSACDAGAKVINLSVSGAGTSAMLTKAITYAKQRGVMVVVSAGNYASDVAGYMPGNIEDAITISATDENKGFAAYSNFGDLIDYAAMGTIIKDMGTEDTSDDEMIQGTSIASAYVSAYAAYILDHNENADVEKCLETSADDFGGSANPACFGKGYLSLENLIFDNNRSDSGTEDIGENDTGEGELDERVDEEESQQPIKTQTPLYGTQTINLSARWDVTETNNVMNGANVTVNGNGYEIRCMTNAAINYNHAFFVEQGGVLTVNNAIINANALDDNNEIIRSRCGVTNNGGRIVLNNCTIKNAGIGGWGVRNSEDGVTGGVVTLNNCTVQSCRGNGVANNGTMIIKDCTLTGNRVDFANGGGKVTITNSNFVNSKTYKDFTVSYGIDHYAGTLTMTGGGIYSNVNGMIIRATASLKDVDIYNNQKNGIIVGEDGTATLNNLVNVYANNFNIQNKGTLTINSGVSVYHAKVDTNGTGGINVYNLNNGIVNMKGGRVYDAAKYNLMNDRKLESNTKNRVTISSGTIEVTASAQKAFQTSRNIYNEDGTVIIKNFNADTKPTIRNAKDYNVYSKGTTTISGGNIYNSGSHNVVNIGGTLKMSGGTVQMTEANTDSNGEALGSANVFTSSSGTTTISGGVIHGATTHNVYNYSGTTNISGGTIYFKGTRLDATGKEIGTSNVYVNTGTVNITGGTIKDAPKMNVDIKNGTVNFKGGSITGSGAGYPGVQIEKVDSATFNQYANIGTNDFSAVRNIAQGLNRYNVYNGATSAVGSNGKDTGVFLAEGASMTIHQPLTEDIKVASYDRYTGKVIADCDSEAIAQSAQEHLKLTDNASYQKTTLNTRAYADIYPDLKDQYGYNYEALWNHYNTYGKSEGRTNEDANKTVVYRKGNGETGAKTQIIVSQVEDTTFDKNLADNGLTKEVFSARVRTSDTFTGHKNAKWRDYVQTYWGEINEPRAESIVYYDGQDVSKSIYNSGWATTKEKQDDEPLYGRILSEYRCWYPTTLYARYETGYDPNANHNDLDDPSSDDGTEDILDPAPEEPEIEPSNPDDPEKPKPQGYSYFFCGNGQEKGNNYTVRHVPSVYAMPGYDEFEKRNTKGHGWSVLSDATYKDTEEPTKRREEGELVTTLALLNAIVERDDCEILIEDGNITVTQFLVWDEPPTIVAKDSSIAFYQVRTLSDNEIKEIIFRTCIGKDKEDGDPDNHNIIPNNVAEGEIGVTIVDFDKSELMKFENHGTGNVSITFRATDGVGQTADATVRLWINSENPIEGAYINRARCINKKYYDAGKGYDTLDKEDPHYLDGYKQGGLMPNDLWYTDEKRAKTIEEAFANLESENWEFSWKFTHEQVLETQDYIEEHGFGDSLEDGALQAYYNKYKGNILINKLPKICDRGKHDIEKATCTKAAYCKICGEIFGKAEHDYHREIGKKQEVCTRCGDVKE
ncbi:MAG: S8 family serine peptidase [Lachnospiraceae bacterium]|nr:S8 family serine peptidase [Lachnospiraceae bacterium]